MPEDEILIHRKMKAIEGKYETKTNWGKISLTLDAIPNYAGGKGCPDEILAVKVEFAVLGTDIKLVAPVLVEGEKSGYGNAALDLKKFCERSISGEQNPHLEIPMIVVGGANVKKLKRQQRQMAARFRTTQVPRRIIE